MDDLRRVLFEISKDGEGNLNWHIDRELTPEGLFMLAGTLRFVEKKIHIMLYEVDNDE